MKLDIKTVVFCPGGDGNTAFYINDELVMEGDHYHDKIDDKIEGFLKGLKFVKQGFKHKNIYPTTENPHIDEEGICYSVPKNYKDLEIERYGTNKDYE